MGEINMITVNNLSKNYHNKKILDQISFSVKKKEIFGIMGNSGSGKSTLLRCINGLIPFEEGQVVVSGTDISALNNREMNEFRSHIGMIFQNFSLVERLNVFENIALPLKIKKISKSVIKEKVERITQLINIEDKLYAYPHQLSGGQKQRVAIARALVTEPELILSDEATSALDPETTASILTLYEKLNHELGVTFMVVSHEMNVLKLISHRVMEIRNGKAINLSDPLTQYKQKRLLSMSKEWPNQPRIQLLLFVDLEAQSNVINQLIIEDNSLIVMATQSTKFKYKTLSEFEIEIAFEHYLDIKNILELNHIEWAVNYE
ncbi:ATP-binding cassette domain-containing protein [Facklamia sp. DSM 111018]|uniref:ATP-binding cassette domain-containing protein n=2 Tax=Facklamia lactis TaxID=2749967 RepID=A0ABS0LNS6_9LACT|nr:ATP-binding cassette domain-containing protein [Facklamia lactis]